MIDGDAIERAERILQVTYQEGDTPGQLRQMEVEINSFNSWLEHRKGSAMKQNYRAYKNMDPRIEPAWNTLLMHFFLVGIVCGRDERVVIE